MINCVFGLCAYLTKEQRIVAMETGTLGHGYHGNQDDSLNHSRTSHYVQALVLRPSPVPEKVSVNQK